MVMKLRYVDYNDIKQCKRFEVDVCIDKPEGYLSHNVMQSDLKKDYIISIRRGKTNSDGFVDWYADILYSRLVPTVKFNMMKWADDMDLQKVAKRALYLLADNMAEKQNMVFSLIEAMSDLMEGNK